MNQTDPSRWSCAVPAAHNQLAGVRNRLQRWLAAQAIPATMCADVVMAVDEAMANAVEHGHRDHPGAGPVTVTAEITPERVAVSVTDRGSWKQPTDDPASTRGRGLKMIKMVAEWVDLARTPQGTSLTAHFLRRHALRPLGC